MTETHPQLQPKKTGVLLLNLGTPDATDYFSMRRYLSEFLSDRRVIDYPAWLWQPLLQGVILTSRPFRSGRAYRKVWDKQKNASPLLVHTEEICAGIRKSLKKTQPDLVIEFAMRYGNPSTASGIKRLVDQGCRHILLLALYPQYSATTTATAYDKVFEYLASLTWQPSISTASHWHDDPAYIDCLAQSFTDTLKKKTPDAVVISFHGLPKRYLTQGDPYHCFCLKTSRLLREKLNWPEEKWHTTFQSRFGPEEWLQPYTDRTLEALAADGVKHVAVMSPGFVCDCLETLEEIAMEAKECFLQAGGKEYTYIPCLNAGKKHIAFLSDLIQKNCPG